PPSCCRPRSRPRSARRCRSSSDRARRDARMNFFERQDQARRSTKGLVAIFVVAVACIVISIDIVMAAAWMWLQPHTRGVPVRPVPVSILVVTSIVTIGVIFCVSTFKVVALRAGGGAAVADMMGGRRVEPNTTDPLEKRLLNVVEEMAIAAGTRVPA